MTRHRMAEQVDLARVRLDQPERQAQRGGLARAVGPEQPEAFAGAQLEIDAAHYFAASVGLAHSAQGQHRFGSHSDFPSQTPLMATAYTQRSVLLPGFACAVGVLIGFVFPLTATPAVNDALQLDQIAVEEVTQHREGPPPEASADAPMPRPPTAAPHRPPRRGPPACRPAPVLLENVRSPGQPAPAVRTAAPARRAAWRPATARRRRKRSPRAAAAMAPKRARSARATASQSSLSPIPSS